MQQHDKVQLLFDMTAMSGYEPEAMNEDLGMSRYLDDIERMAVVSDSRLMNWAGSLADAMPGIKMRHFEPGQEAQAWAWLR